MFTKMKKWSGSKNSRYGLWIILPKTEQYDETTSRKIGVILAQGNKQSSPYV